MSYEQYQEILSCYSKLIKGDFEGYISKKIKMRIPIIPRSLFQSLLEESKNIFMNEPMLLNLSTPIYVVGDIHGHILDLLRFLKEFGLPPDVNYLFLGDFIDRGSFSTETLVLVLVLKILYPSNIYIIRGNHEFSTILDHSDFFSELVSLYSDDTLSTDIMNCFSYMPIAATIDEYAICVHGGIGESLIFLYQLNSIQRPLTTFDDGLVTEILWSDPTNEANVDYQPSPRGLGKLFGLRPASNFLERNGYRYLIRGHQCVKNGCEASLNYKVITVFSASNYCGVENNQSGVLLLLADEMYEFKTFPSTQNEITRNEASFVPLDIYNSSPRRKSIVNNDGLDARNKANVNKSNSSNQIAKQLVNAHHLLPSFGFPVNPPATPHQSPSARAQQKLQPQPSSDRKLSKEHTPSRRTSLYDKNEDKFEISDSLLATRSAKKLPMVFLPKTAVKPKFGSPAARRKSFGSRYNPKESL